jgi:hypothetical protein
MLASLQHQKNEKEAEEGTETKYIVLDGMEEKNRIHHGRWKLLLKKMN